MLELLEAILDLVVISMLMRYFNGLLPTLYLLDRCLIFRGSFRVYTSCLTGKIPN